MKKIYLTLVLPGILCSIGIQAQFNPTTPPTLGKAQEVEVVNTKTTETCGNDTLLYTLSKATSVEAQAFSSPDFYVNVAQRYEVPQPVTVYGMCYYGYTDASGTLPGTVTARMYSVGLDGLPDTVMASAIDALPLGSATPYTANRRCVSWLTPITISDDFYVALDGSTTSEPIGTYRNSFTAADGAGEGLSAVYFDDGSGAGYVRWYDQTNDPAFTTPGPAWDYDYLLEPVVSYDVTFTATWSADTICSGEEVCVESDTISDPIVVHRMYSLDTSPEATTDWGDGGFSLGDSNCTIYSIDGLYTAIHGIEVIGWTTTCVVSDTNMIFVDQSTADFTYVVSNDTVTFTNSSTGATTYMWDFGGMGSSVAQDTTFVFPSNGMYTVELITWSANGCADTTEQVVAITVGIEDNELPQISLYPNPTLGALNIVNTQAGEEFDLIIIDLTGKVVYQDRLVHATNLIDLTHLANGHYVSRISNTTGARTDRIEIIK